MAFLRTMFRCFNRPTSSRSDIGPLLASTVNSPWMPNARRAHFGIACSRVDLPEVDPQKTQALTAPFSLPRIPAARHFLTWAGTACADASRGQRDRAGRGAERVDAQVIRAPRRGSWQHGPGA